MSNVILNGANTVESVATLLNTLQEREADYITRVFMLEALSAVVDTMKDGGKFTKAIMRKVESEIAFIDGATCSYEQGYFNIKVVVYVGGKSEDLTLPNNREIDKAAFKAQLDTLITTRKNKLEEIRAQLHKADEMAGKIEKLNQSYAALCGSLCDVVSTFPELQYNIQFNNCAGFDTDGGYVFMNNRFK